MKNGDNLTEIGALPEGREPQIYRTRMTRIGRIFTDNFDPCASVSSVQSVQSVFYSNPAIIDDDKKPQIKAPRVAPLGGASTSTVAPVDVAHTYGSHHTWRDVSMHCGGHDSNEGRYGINNELVLTDTNSNLSEFVPVSSLLISVLRLLCAQAHGHAPPQPALAVHLRLNRLRQTAKIFGKTQIIG